MSSSEAERRLAVMVASIEADGYTVLHSYVFDLQDGTFNVKAITKERGTIGFRISDE